MKTATHSISHIDLKHLRWFVYGAVAEWDRASGANLGTTSLVHYSSVTETKVLAYLSGITDADASFSDLQCTIALEAKALFKPVPKV